MATRVEVRYVSRRFSSGGKILSEEEKAVENIYIKKMEQERLEKLARQVNRTEWVGSRFNVSTDKNKNYAVVAGVVAGLGALGWYLKSKNKKTDELHE